MYSFNLYTIFYKNWHFLKTNKIMLIDKTDKKRELNQDRKSLSLKSEDRYRMPSNQRYAIDWFIKKSVSDFFQLFSFGNRKIPRQRAISSGFPVCFPFASESFTVGIKNGHF